MSDLEIDDNVLDNDYVEPDDFENVIRGMARVYFDLFKIKKLEIFMKSRYGNEYFSLAPLDRNACKHELRFPKDYVERIMNTYRSFLLDKLENYRLELKEMIYREDEEEELND